MELESYKLNVLFIANKIHLKMQLAKGHLNSFCLEEDTGDLRLKEDRAYYYQMQLQMKICQVKCADFVLWREEDMFVQKI